MDSVSYGGLHSPAIAASFVYYDMPQTGADFWRYRAQEQWHVHPILDGNRQLKEVYFVTSGYSQVLCRLNSFLFYCINPEFNCHH